tara:strand:- start:1127 stop:1339 length:213 start_codon:yes stop_codon:yes gene_type:complete
MSEDDDKKKRRGRITRLGLLKERHRELNVQVDELNRRKTLGPKERMKLKVLKVRKLRLKDALLSLDSDVT